MFRGGHAGVGGGRRGTCAGAEREGGEEKEEREGEGDNGVRGSIIESGEMQLVPVFVTPCSSNYSHYELKMLGDVSWSENAVGVWRSFSFGYFFMKVKYEVTDR